MNTHDRIVNALLRLYPPSWRAEYGAELTDLLRRRRLASGAVGDVFLNGLRARVRAELPAAIIGCLMSGVVITAYASGATVLEPTHITLPSLVVAQTNPRNELYVLVLVSRGLGTRLRRGGTVRRSAWAAAVVTLVADLPVLVVGLATPSPAVVAAPFLALPYASVWGAAGGQLGSWIVALRQRFARA